MRKLLRILPHLCEHIDNDKMSILSYILGIYTVKLNGMRPLRLILQKNCINVSEGNKLLSIFDMKGSTFKRNTIK